MDKRNRQIWKGIVDYANADLSSDAFLRGLCDTVLRCMPWLSRYDFYVTEFDILGLLRCQKGDASAVEQVRKEAAEYQAGLRQLLSWLCNPSAENSEERLGAVRFLLDHQKHIQFVQAEPDFEKSSPENLSYWKPSGEPWDCMLHPLHRTPEYKDIIDPICDFILTEHEKLHQNELPSDELVPIRVCARPACGGFIIPERKGRKKFCSDNCRALNQGQDKSLEEKKYYMTVWRLEQKHVGTLRQELEKPERQHRLVEIETRFPKFALRIDALRKRAEKPRATKAENRYKVSS